MGVTAVLAPETKFSGFYISPIQKCFFYYNETTMIPIGSVLGAGSLMAGFAQQDPIFQVLPLVAATLGVICLTSFVLARVIKRVIARWDAGHPKN